MADRRGGRGLKRPSRGGRKRKTFSHTLSDEVCKVLEVAATNLGVSRSAIVEDAIIEWAAKRGYDTPPTPPPASGEPKERE